ncbi:hypothetical protein ES708_34160 [subsurface metagenome]
MVIVATKLQSEGLSYVKDLKPISSPSGTSSCDAEVNVGGLSAGLPVPQSISQFVPVKIPEGGRAKAVNKASDGVQIVGCVTFFKTLIAGQGLVIVNIRTDDN